MKEEIKINCIYCKRGVTKKNPMLFRVYAIGEYWQHWSFENKGCKKNINNISPSGVLINNQKINNY